MSLNLAINECFMISITISQMYTRRALKRKLSNQRPSASSMFWAKTNKINAEMWNLSTESGKNQCHKKQCKAKLDSWKVYTTWEHKHVVASKEKNKLKAKDAFRILVNRLRCDRQEILQYFGFHDITNLRAKFVNWLTVLMLSPFRLSFWLF